MNKSNALKVAALVVILGGSVFFALRQSAPHPVAIGERAPEFSVPALPAGELDLKNYTGQVVVVNLWATWCPPCVEETPSLVQFAGKMQSHGVVVLGISVDQDLSALNDFVQKYQLHYPIGRDPNQALSSRYGTYQFPESYILDRNGRLAEKIIGATDWDDDRLQSFVLNLAGK